MNTPVTSYIRELLVSTLGAKYNIPFAEIERVTNDFDAVIERADSINTLNGNTFEKTFSVDGPGTFRHRDLGYWHR